ncbi:ATP-binding protein [Siphonobacter sp. SORGH_AS_1065]|uniref:sensor histidine kinase n=1 Tax=Siphonobacter sp. SORGH_AS_1065 TaxID=3041795 RepID=UPI002780907C|nr:ATP-binding protein [Siphonobacter sp. SORGH_AS_1065]MDQ1088711.1 light-regulated signal transduction histidine kinase (bacteriophytochrome) [Siphonobacter sp. SORGH_AS_1065]
MLQQGGEIEYVNEHWYKYSRQLDQFPEMHPDDNIHLEWETYLKQGVEYIKETRLKELTTGEYRYHLLRITPIKFEEVTVRWVGTFTDIHQQKINAEILEQKVELRTKELLDKNVELERTNHELQQFAWVVSHDLKEPLRKIQIFNGVIKEKYLKDNNEAISYLDRSIQSSARMSRLISDVLEYSRLSNSSSFQETNLNEILHELLIDFDDLISRKEAIVSVGNLPVISAMPSRIRQVFQNLISNALKFSKPTVAPVIHITGELVADKSIDSPAKENGAFCRIIVEDNGIGFDEKFLNRIFIIFQRLNDQSSYEGTGIGLAIAKKNIDTHNGIISAKSQMGEGTSFIIVLPVNQTNHVLK